MPAFPAHSRIILIRSSKLSQMLHLSQVTELILITTCCMSPGIQSQINLLQVVVVRLQFYHMNLKETMAALNLTLILTLGSHLTAIVRYHWLHHIRPPTRLSGEQLIKFACALSTSMDGVLGVSQN